MPLSKYKIVAFANIHDVEKAKEFYGGKLGLRLIDEEPPFALVYDANGIMVRLGMSKEPIKTTGTVLGWEVPDAEAAVKELLAVGITFERYGFLKQDELGIWTTPTGAKVAWFKDPDGNILGVSQHLDRG
jgi:catechol 2,3-dioxygenase-like lactoylglutathione lyase family enzyme